MRRFAFALLTFLIATMMACSTEPDDAEHSEGAVTEESSCDDVRVDLYGKTESVGYLPADPSLRGNDAARRGRCIWTHYTGGTENFFLYAARRTAGKVDINKLLDNADLPRAR